MATLDDLYSELNIVDTAISPSGRYVAAIARLDKQDVLVTFDLTTGERKVIQRAAHGEAGKGLLLHMNTVDWKSDERMLLRLRVRPADVLRFFTTSEARISKLGSRLYAVDRDGKAVGLLADNRNTALEGAFDLGDIRSKLPNDLKHILMELDGSNGRSLFRVNIETGRGEQLEKPLENVRGWWLDVNGNAIVRVSASRGTVRMSRKDKENNWRVFHTMREQDMDEREEYTPLAPSGDPGRYYVLARPPGHDRMGLYLYDLEKEEFGEPVIEHPRYDMDYARISQDGKRALFYCYTAHVQVCEFTDPRANAHMTGLRSYFDPTASVTIHDIGESSEAFLLVVEGPRNPPAYYYFQTAKKDIQLIGTMRTALEEVLATQ